MTIYSSLQDGYRQLCAQLEPNYFVTLATNDYGSLNRVRKLAKNYCARMDRRLIGHLWSKALAADRTDGIFFVEHVASNIHLHGLLRFPRGTTAGLSMMSALVWSKLCPKGTVNVQGIYGLSNLTHYCIKEHWAACQDDQIILVRELMGGNSS